MSQWLSAAIALARTGTPAVLVTVAGAEGSTPREAGAKMLVSADGQWDTIGGGHLEWRALELARGLLRDHSAQGACATHWLSLGPSLAQCCGGAVTLLFETLGACDIAWLEGLEDALASGQACERTRMLGRMPAGPREPGGPWLEASQVELRPIVSVAGALASRRGASLLTASGGNMGLRESIAPVSMHVVLFGAGHVGQALIRVLANLPCRVSWVDERDAQFPAQVPANVQIEATDTPEAVIDASPPHTFYLVMTHSHALDEQLCRHILRKGAFGYLGLIGSRTKRVKFECRLLQRGIPPAMLARMICPIGVPGIRDKSPEVIAVAVAAQLLQARELGMPADTIARDGDTRVQNAPRQQLITKEP